MSGLRVSVAGAGIAWPVTAYWLAQAGAHVTVVERASSVRTGGQNVDIRSHGLTVLKRMGLEQRVYENTTEESGVKFVESNNISRADYSARDDKSFSAEVEIMRGVLAQLFYQETKGRVEYIFGTSITRIENTADSAKVAFADARPSHNYDLIIGADGQS